MSLATTPYPSERENLPPTVLYNLSSASLPPSDITVASRMMLSPASLASSCPPTPIGGVRSGSPIKVRYSAGSLKVRSMREDAMPTPISLSFPIAHNASSKTSSRSKPFEFCEEDGEDEEDDIPPHTRAFPLTFPRYANARRFPLSEDSQSLLRLATANVARQRRRLTSIPDWATLFRAQPTHSRLPIPFSTFIPFPTRMSRPVLPPLHIPSSGSKFFETGLPPQGCDTDDTDDTEGEGSSNSSTPSEPPSELLSEPPSPRPSASLHGTLTTRLFARYAAARKSMRAPHATSFRRSSSASSVRSAPAAPRPKASFLRRIAPRGLALRTRSLPVRVDVETSTRVDGGERAGARAGAGVGRSASVRRAASEKLRGLF
ncbi:hypothetical protein HETIRDRAFT_449940 [Heterobasidion irregulare TC 32-1]|uniref:Uncharacterized protein n=1 Tax=Heterobasidion irregulare (strain TC 32-1) TaxID=747525 RepID=W4KFH4_HETIT|nr:uncharacterized protein HETIRDRAFT_449940 [Heterobasidion irregulare TC 32-1]ETW84479.1 hypothetical protein HETIRDRAFT_449940 [Heterobasidion irregulare TC 32-1]